MNKTVVFEPVSEIAMLKRRVEQLERVVAEMRGMPINTPAYGNYPKWCPPPSFGDQFWLNAPQANQ